MKNRRTIRITIGLFLGLVVCLGSSSLVHGTTEMQLEWPRVIYRDGVTNTIYQPQLESWDYYTLKASSAVAIKPAGAKQPTFGTIHLVGKTRVDRADREVQFDEISIESADFPVGGDQTNAYLTTLRSLLPKDVKTISLDRLEASLAILQERQKATGQSLKNDPPAILFSATPAMLLLVDGPPVYRPVPDTELDRVFNTRALILRRKSGMHYLHLYDGYLEATSLNGPWTICNKPPSELKKAEKQAVAAKQVDLLAGQENPETKKKPSLKSGQIPTIYVATVPTELIVIQGEAQWAPITPTQLLYVTNSTANIFKSVADQKNYILISGRWFRAASLEGPWEFVPAADLPKDFADIPDDSPKENVKASVPGTHQAEEAVIANGIPNTVKVDRKKAKLDPPPQYDGTPQLKPIEGTSLFYVENSSTPVIQVTNQLCYANRSGVWFVSASLNGPWMVATNVPAVMYSIPPSSPMHYLIYSRIYNYNDDYVWVGTSPGYYGAMVSSDDVVVYGTGYTYPPYVGNTVYVSYYVTYGYGCNPCWTPWAGWAMGFTVCWASANSYYWWCCCPPCPYWGPYYYPCYGAYYNAYGGVTAWGPYGWAGTSGYIYHQNGSWTGVSRSAAGYNAWTGNQWATQYGRAYNSSTGTSVVGQRGAVQNVYTGNYAYGGRGAFYNENTGVAGAGSKVTWGNANTGDQGSAGRGTVYNPNTGNSTQVGYISGEKGSAVNVNGNVVVGKDGNYYRPDGSGGWEQVTRPGNGASQLPANSGGQPKAQTQAGQNQAAQDRQWQQANVDAQQRKNLDQQNNARQQGEQRQQSFQQNRPAFRGGGGGGRRR